MQLDLLIKYSYKLLRILCFSLPLICLYNMILVGAGGHSVGSGAVILLFLGYGFLIFMLLNLVRKVENKRYNKIIRFFLIIALLPILIYLGGLLYALVTIGDLHFEGFAVLIISVMMVISIVFVIIGLSSKRLLDRIT